MASWVLLVLLGTANALLAQAPAVHYLHQGVMPPGAIGKGQLVRGGPLPGFFQPVEIKAPAGALISLASGGQLDAGRQSPVRVGMLIGQVYRLRVTQIPLNPGMEVFPTVEVIDRLYAPADQVLRFPIPVELTQQDLELALSGKFVTRVIYLEDPLRALPARQDPGGQGWYEVAPGRDPLAEADALGRPMAILRLGARVPDHAIGPDAAFLFGCPPFVPYPSAVRMLPPPPREPAGPEPIQTPRAQRKP